jgi:hypothetical protein
MLDLFRFVSLRPPQTPDPSGVISISPSSALQKQLTGAGGPAALVRTARDLLTAGKGLVKQASALAYGQQYPLFATALDASKPPITAASIDQVVNQIFGLSSKAVVATAGFKSDSSSVTDTLILAKLAADGTGIDVDGLNVALRAIAVIRSVASGNATPPVNPIFSLGMLPLAQPAPAAATAPAVPAPAPATLPVADFVRAIQVLRSIPPSALQQTQIASGANPLLPQLSAGRTAPPKAAARTSLKLAQNRGAALAVQTKAANAALKVAPANTAIPTASPTVPNSLDPAVQRVANLLQLDMTKTSVPQALDIVTLALQTQLGASTQVAAIPEILRGAGAGPHPLPPPAPSIGVTPVGIGDLLVVKQRLKRYEQASRISRTCFALSPSSGIRGACTRRR